MSLFIRPRLLRWISWVGVMGMMTACSVALPRVNPMAEAATVNLSWENSTDHRYFITIGDARDNTLSGWLPVEPCMRGGVRGLIVTMPDDIGIGPADGAHHPTVPFAGGIDSANLLAEGSWTIRIEPDDPNDDLVLVDGSPMVSIGPGELNAGLPQQLC